VDQKKMTDWSGLWYYSNELVTARDPSTESKPQESAATLTKGAEREGGRRGEQLRAVQHGVARSRIRPDRAG